MDRITAKITRRKIQISLGFLWLLDGALQLQHRMFTNAFATQVIAPSGQGQPAIISNPINFEVHTILIHPALFNAFFATIQLIIGILILYRKTIKIGLIASIVWGFGVWYMGEGLAGILSGHASLISGAPGAALIYIILALASYPTFHKSVILKKLNKDHKIAQWLSLSWVLFWVSGAIYQLLPGQNSTSSIANLISNNISSSTPSWLNYIDNHLSNFIINQKYDFVILLFLLEITIGILVLAKNVLRYVGIISGVLLALLFWIVGQSLGSYYTGIATDPNSGPLFVLLAIAIVGAGNVEYGHIQNRIITLKNSLRSKFIPASEELE